MAALNCLVSIVCPHVRLCVSLLFLPLFVLPYLASDYFPQDAADNSSVWEKKAQRDFKGRVDKMLPFATRVSYWSSSILSLSLSNSFQAEKTIQTKIWRDQEWMWNTYTDWTRKDPGVLFQALFVLTLVLFERGWLTLNNVHLGLLMLFHGMLTSKGSDSFLSLPLWIHQWTNRHPPETFFFC